jgi:hypothetical protein
MATCKSCGAEIVWVQMILSGKRMPLDAKPEKRIHLVGRAGLGSETEPEAVVGDVYTSHFATCPNANEHRRRS